MNKAELIAVVAEKTAVSRKDVDKVVNSVLDTIMETLKNGEKVSLVGFGAFEAKDRPARKGHNPMTGLSDETRTTDDLLFTVEIVNCLGACGLAPVIVIDGEVHGQATPEQVEKIIDEITAAEKAAAESENK